MKRGYYRVGEAIYSPCY